MRKKVRIEDVVVLGLIILFMIALGCSKQPLAPRPLSQPVTRQTEAKGKLLEIYQMQLAYRQYGGIYWGEGSVGSAADPYVFLPISVDFNCTNRYTYVMEIANTNSFLCKATSGILDNDASQDMWQIDHTGSLVVLSDDTIF